MTGPTSALSSPTHPSVVGQVGKERLYEIRWPDGRRFDSRRTIDSAQARLLVEAGICDEVRSPSGILRYLKMRRNPPLNGFAQILAQADFTTVRTGNLQEHRESKRKGL